MMDGSEKVLDIKFQRRFSTNLLSNVVYFILNIIVGLALVPYFLDTLGEAAYGLVPLATSLTSYVTIVIDVLNASISRYLTIDLQKSDIQRANETFNSALFGTLVVIFILIPVVLAIGIVAPSFFNIGDQTKITVFFLFVLVMGSVLIRAWSSNFMVTLFAYNRLDLRNYVNCIYLLLQVCCVVLLFAITTPSLISVGLSYVGAALVALIMAIYFSRKICPFLMINRNYFSKKRFIAMAGMSFGIFFTYMGGLLNVNISLIMVNKLFGDIAGTEYSLAFMWYTLLIGISSLITTIFTPMIYAYYSKNDIDGLKKFTKLSVRCVGFTIALLVALVSIFAPQLLTLWVGGEYAKLAPLVCLIIMPVLCRSQASCISPIFFAYGKVWFPALANICVGILNVILCLTIPIIFNIGIYGIACAVLISSIVINVFIDTMYNAYLIKAPRFTFIKSMAAGIGAYAILLAIGNIYVSIISVDSLLMLILSGFIISIPYLLLIVKMGITKTERRMICSCLPATVQKLIPDWIL